MKKIPIEPREPSEISPKVFEVKVDRSTVNSVGEDSAPAELHVSTQNIILPEKYSRLKLLRKMLNFGSRGESTHIFEYIAAGTAMEMRDLITDLQGDYPGRITYSMRLNDEVNSWGRWFSGPSFEYIPTEVSCGLCKAKFPHTKLGGRCSCPVCGIEECCIIQYESYDPSMDKILKDIAWP